MDSLIEYNVIHLSLGGDGDTRVLTAMKISTQFKV